ncbi:MAG: DUF3602 domain-containing protein [Akkermansiaceae bacterium]|nr:DUF3602 domain-containing protein [Akkermansiaceae bacterium]
MHYHSVRCTVCQGHHHALCYVAHPRASNGNAFSAGIGGYGNAASAQIRRDRSFKPKKAKTRCSVTGATVF